MSERRKEIQVFDLDVYEDERGWFKESFNKQKLVAQGLPEDFETVQNNVSFNRLGTTRGIHAEPWDKYVSIAHGAAFIALVDLRKESFGELFCKKVTVHQGIYIPKGFGNSFQALEDNTVYNYLVNDYWSPDKEYKMVSLYDPELAIEWPIEREQAIISEKDLDHPQLKDVEPFV